MTAPIKIAMADIDELRLARENAAGETLRTLWRGRWLLISAVFTFVLFASVWIVVVAPQYTAEAIVQFDFGRAIGGSSPGDPISVSMSQIPATLDASDLVESAVRLIRSRATADAVVVRLGLDKDPDFAHEQFLSRTLRRLQIRFGLESAPPIPTDRELAINELMRRVVVKSEPHSYLISVTVSLEEPERAAALANAVSIEYLRNRYLQRLREENAAAEMELAHTSTVYGERHPGYMRARGTLERIQSELKTAAQGDDVTGGFKLAVEQWMTPAEPRATPSFPNVKLTIGLAAVMGLVIGGTLTLRRRGREKGAKRIYHNQSKPDAG